MRTGRLLRDLQRDDGPTVPRDRADVLAEMLRHAQESGDPALVAMVQALILEPVDEETVA